MNRLFFVFQLFCLCLVALWLTPTGCSQQPECRSDGDCITLRSDDYLCFEQQCRLKSVVLKNRPPRAERKADAGSEPKAEPKADAGLEPKPEAKPRDEVAPEPSKPETPKETVSEGPSDGGKLSIGAPCEQSLLLPNEERCAPGLSCVRLNALTAYCFQDCSKDATLCAGNADGRNRCQQVGWTNEENSKPISICIKPSKEGESCDPQQSLFCKVEKGSSSALTCEKGKCVKAKQCDSIGCACGTTSSPPVVCDVTKRLACDYSTNKCVAGIRAFEGEPCDNYPGPKRVCELNHFCVTYGGGALPHLCLKTCELSRPKETCNHRSPKSFNCISIGNNRGVCVQDNCGKQGDCSFQSYPHTCLVKSGNRGCNPLPFTGKRKFGENCRTDKGAEFNCAHPLKCLANFCTLQCSNSGNCAVFDPQSQCTLRSNNDNLSYCGYRCSGTCPKKLKCNSQNFCIGVRP